MDVSKITSADIVNDTVKILGCHHSYNKQLADDRNFVDTAADTQFVLNLWSWRGLSLLGRIQIFNTSGISKIQYLAFLSHIPDKIIQELKSIQSRFLSNSSTPKIKRSTLIGDHAEEGLKNVDIDTKLKALKLTRVRRLGDDNYNPWKCITWKLTCGTYLTGKQSIPESQVYRINKLSLKTNHWRQIGPVIVFVTVSVPFNVWVEVCSLNIVFSCVRVLNLFLYVMLGDCLQCYCYVITISVISLAN